MLAAVPLLGAAEPANFGTRVGSLETQFPRILKVFVGGDMNYAPDFPLHIKEVRGTQDTLTRGGVYLIEGSFHAPPSAELIVTQQGRTVATPLEIQSDRSEFAVVVKLNGSGLLHLSYRAPDGTATYGAVHLDSALPKGWVRKYGGYGVYYDRRQLEPQIKVAETRHNACNWDALDQTGASDNPELVGASFHPICDSNASVNTCTVVLRSAKKQ